MNDNNESDEFGSLVEVAEKIRNVLEKKNLVLLFGHNGTGKTRLSVEFKNQGKKKRDDKTTPDTLYFNAFTEDLFSWENDFENDDVKPKHHLNVNSKSKFFHVLRDKKDGLDDRIRKFLSNYANFSYEFDDKKPRISFSRKGKTNIKISRGEESIFIWCFFLAIYETAIDEKKAGKKDGRHGWIKNAYIDDPISSLDDNNAISVAIDLVELLKKGGEDIKVVISTHHSLFYNVMWNGIVRAKLRPKSKSYFFRYTEGQKPYTLRPIGDTPFFYHLAMLVELQQAIKEEEVKIYPYHFNILRSIMEKTAAFLGEEKFESCIPDGKNKDLLVRTINTMSHGNGSIFESDRVEKRHEKIFEEGLKDFIKHHRFNLPQISES